ncbi:LysE family translocator [Streptomyces xantholiticus]|uniref:LysE family translocator n=1 Tax=Streptomyces xantholiticus TaxID=68285 RepID=UPI0016769988|nr:LysE family transporter [Streptomyces xantholiticus]GGW58749.1 lysine transporter LysE [Streptomyces xantholiticus]
MGQMIAVAVITVLAVISPGADFAMTVRNSYLYGRTAGLLSALGISLGVLVHVAYTMLGVGLLVSRTPTLFTVMKIVGAVYLVYIGYKTFVARTQTDDIEIGDAKGLSEAGALRTGFLTNALNPKTMLFVLSTYTQVVSADTPVVQQVGYGLFMSVAHLVWFSLAALLFSQQALRAKLLSRQAVLNKVIGAVLVGLGVTLALTPAVQ